NGVVITSKTPAVPVFPNKEYGVGNLKPSEFSNFQISFEVPENTTEVPIQSTFRDSEGRVFSKETNLSLGPDILMPMPAEPETGMGGEIIPGTGITLPLLGVICIVCIAGYIYLRRRGGTRFIRTWKRKPVADAEPASSPPAEPGIARGENDSSPGLFREGMNYYAEKQYRQAAEIFNRIVGEDNTNHRAWNALGICLTRLGEYDSAAQCYRNALALEPDNGSYARNSLINENKRKNDPD
ncbi:MAG: tetratricopeptide repeat protein, partial [Methanospirillum sp.]|nr:tetratricopeptide repeat protein [Methanospirillum sp.]